MSDARKIEEWDRVAWTIFWIPKFTRREHPWTFYHPIRCEDVVSLSKLQANLKACADAAGLPETSSDADIESRWKKHLKESDHAG